ncbi:MAG: LysR family transcriptional regulator [Rhizobiales bacterium]|nr:LysR family transcriptional regulator [Hyphomicrobiales bacterium]
MDWDDLRVFLQVARARQMTAAGQALGMDDSTVGRRVARLEKALGVSLVERAGRRTAISESGVRLAEAIEKVESVIFREIMDIGEQAALIAGRVRIGAPEGFGVGYLARRLATLSILHERLETELVALPRSYSLAAREVDIAITLERPVTGQVVVRKLTDYALDLYGTQDYFARRGRPQSIADLGRHVFAGYIPELLFTKELRFLDVGEGAAFSPSVRSTSVIAQVNAVRSGAAIGVLPRFLAAEHPALERILPEEVCLIRSYWISVHDDLRHLQRVKEVMSAIATATREDAHLFFKR